MEELVLIITGRAGRSFTDEIARLLNIWNDGPEIIWDLKLQSSLISQESSKDLIAKELSSCVGKKNKTLAKKVI